MSKNKTKRREVWVTFDRYGPGGAYRDRKGAAARVKWAAKLTDADLHEEAARMVEARRGDVVLSREDVKELRALAYCLNSRDADRALALLRGGR